MTFNLQDEPLSTSAADFFFSSDLARRFGFGISSAAAAAWLDLGSSEVVLRAAPTDFPNRMPREAGLERLPLGATAAGCHSSVCTATSCSCSLGDLERGCKGGSSVTASGERRFSPAPTDLEEVDAVEG